MSKHIKSIVAGLVFGASVGAIGLAAFSPSAATANPSSSSSVARISPQNLCEIVNANKPGRHWCDRQGRLHYR